MVNPFNFLKKQRQKNEKNLEQKEPLVETLNEIKGKSDEPNFIFKVFLINILKFLSGTIFL